MDTAAITVEDRARELCKRYLSQGYSKELNPNWMAVADLFEQHMIDIVPLDDYIWFYFTFDGMEWFADGDRTVFTDLQKQIAMWKDKYW